MLKQEDAQKRLAGVRSDAHCETRVAAALTLSGPARQAALVILERDLDGNPYGYQWPPERNEVEREGLRWLESASAKERVKVFRAAFNGLADAIERGWQFLPSMTYQDAWSRKPFRAPGVEALFRTKRHDLLRTLYRALATISPETLTLPWLAAWVPHLGYAADRSMSALFAADIDAGNTEVYEILLASAHNEHDVGSMGRHVTGALLHSSKPEAWQFVENLLLAAQRQEGLRQVILEAVDEAHPDAFRRMLRVILDNNLVRFSATARAIDVWFGFQWDSLSAGAFNKILTQIVDLLDDSKARSAALASNDPETHFYALWAIAYEDAHAALAAARQRLKDKKPEIRFAALTLIMMLRLPECRPVLIEAMADDDLRIAVAGNRALRVALCGELNQTLASDGFFEATAKLIDRMPTKTTVSMKPLIWPWTALSVTRGELLLDLVGRLGDRPLETVLRYRDDFDQNIRRQLAYILSAKTKWDAVERTMALEFAGDASVDVRAAALTGLARTKIDADEAERLESFLTRKANDLRRGVLGLLLSQKDAAALASADRLLASKDARQRWAALEILRQMAEADRRVADCRSRAVQYRESRRTLTKEEQSQLDAILAERQAKLSLDDALGLMNPADRTLPTPPVANEVPAVTPAALACVQSLDAFIDEHRDEEVVLPRTDPPEKRLLGNLSYAFYVPHPSQPDQTFAGQELFERWYAGRPATAHDDDGHEIERAFQLLDRRHFFDGEDWKRLERKWPALAQLAAFLGVGTQAAVSRGKAPKLNTLLQGFAQALPNLQQLVAHVLQGGESGDVKYWIVAPILRGLAQMHPNPRRNDFVMDVAETVMTRIPADATYTVDDLEKLRHRRYGEEVGAGWDWRDDVTFAGWVDQLTGILDDAQVRRCWNLIRWMDEPRPGALRHRSPLWLVLGAYRLGFATEADLLDDLLGPRHSVYDARFDSLMAFTARKPIDDIANQPRLTEIAERVRTRLFEIEIARGETETVASLPATQIQSLFGLDRLVTILQGLAKSGIQRAIGWRGPGLSKPAVLSHFAKVMFPTDADTPAVFAERMKTAVAERLFPDERLLELAFHAPQWSAHVEAHFGSPGLQEGIWWFLAHMSAFVGDLGDIDTGEAPKEPAAESGKRELTPWERIIAQRTPLTAQERQMGAIDIAWFRRVHEQLGDDLWRRLGEAAKWGASSNKARKALHLGDVILGNASRKELVADIRTKFRKDAVRLLGILPLADGTKRDADLRERYKVLVDYRRYAKELSAMTKPMAMQAAQVGLDNLARTAGYADPMRLEWAMESANLGDLAKGPVTVVAKGMTASLFLDDDRQPQLSFEKAGKALKSLPKELKTNAKIADLIERRADLKRQSSRIRESLESAMCRGDRFSASEMRELASHPLLAPMLERLVLAGDGILGYLAKKGQALRSAGGKFEPIKKSESLRIAHPFDLYESKKWHQWQHECFQSERVQPFKQVFRELYLVTKQERKDGVLSLRYDGQQVQPRQATALFNTRGWTANDGIWKAFHELKLTAEVHFKWGWGTPMEVEGWTLAGIEFRNQEDGKPIALDKAPPRVFSEAMRDLDLVVSVAHRGGVDPEASASTVEMRESLLRETCSLLGIKNYAVKNNHILIDGKLGNYSVHLGSAVVHRRPGGAVCIVPVHAEHRGRLFLPFADSDPKTAEVLTKVLLLARDSEIQDPTILEQLR